MHALRQFILEQMDARGWRPVDLARASGLSKQLVSNLLNDDREVMDATPRRDTIFGLARAFNVSDSVVLSKAAAAMGVPIGDLQPVIFSVSDASDAELIAELARRLEARHRGGGDCGNTAPIASVHSVEVHLEDDAPAGKVLVHLDEQSEVDESVQNGHGESKPVTERRSSGKRP